MFLCTTEYNSAIFYGNMFSGRPFCLEFRAWIKSRSSLSSTLKMVGRGAWVAQSVECLPSARVMVLGSWDQVHVGVFVQRGACFSLCCSSLLVFSLCQINKWNLKKKKKKKEHDSYIPTSKKYINGWQFLVTISISFFHTHIFSHCKLEGRAL